MVSIITELSFLLDDVIDLECFNLNSYSDAYDTLCRLSNYPIFKSGQLLDHVKWGKYNTSGFSQLYYFPTQEYYVVVEHYTGSCDGCLNCYDNEIEYEDEDEKGKLLQILRHNVTKSYVTTNRDDAMTFYKHQNTCSWIPQHYRP